MSLPLKTERLILRGFEAGDAAAFATYRSDPEVARYQSWDTPYPLEQAHAFIREMQEVQSGTPGEWFQLAITLKNTGQLIGDCAYCLRADDPQQAEIGFTLDRRFQGQGYGQEAITRLLNFLFSDYQLHRIQAICDAENGASSRLLERVGMRREGHFIEHVWFKGRWSSEYSYAILRREWLLQK